MKCARVRNTILRCEVVLEEDVVHDGCIIMDYAIIRRGLRLKRAIVDRHNEITSYSCIGFGAAADRNRYHISKREA